MNDTKRRQLRPQAAGSEYDRSAVGRQMYRFNPMDFFRTGKPELWSAFRKVIPDGELLWIELGYLPIIALYAQNNQWLSHNIGLTRRGLGGT